MWKKVCQCFASAAGRLIATCFLSAFAQGLFSGPIFALYSQKLGGNILEIAGGWAIYQGVMGVLIAGVAWWAGDSLLRTQRLLIAGYALAAVVYVSYLFVRTTQQLLVVQAAFGIAMALNNPTWSFLFGRAAHGSPYGCKLWGVASAGYNILMSFGMVLGAVIISRCSWTALFLITGGLMGSAALNQLYMLEEEIS